jgi:hypothetical protein
LDAPPLGDLQYVGTLVAEALQKRGKLEPTRLGSPAFFLSETMAPPIRAEDAEARMLRERRDSTDGRQAAGSQDAEEHELPGVAVAATAHDRAIADWGTVHQSPESGLSGTHQSRAAIGSDLNAAASEEPSGAAEDSEGFASAIEFVNDHRPLVSALAIEIAVAALWLRPTNPARDDDSRRPNLLKRAP